jgi:hypothetical protein
VQEVKYNCPTYLPSEETKVHTGQGDELAAGMNLALIIEQYKGNHICKSILLEM